MVAAPATIRSSSLSLSTGHTIRMVLRVPVDTPQPPANKQSLRDNREEGGEEEEEEEDVDVILPCHGRVFAAVEMYDGPLPCTLECTFEAHSTVEILRQGQGLDQPGQGLAAERCQLLSDSHFETFVYRYTKEKEQYGVSESVVDHDSYQRRIEGHNYLIPTPSYPIYPYQPLLYLSRTPPTLTHIF